MTSTPTTTSSSTTTPTKTGYSFDNRAAEAETQLNALESFLDPISAGTPGRSHRPAGCPMLGGRRRRRLRRPAHGRPPPGPAATSSPPTSRPSRLAPAATIAVRRHDVRHEPPPGGPFDVIHARLVLLHLPERKRVLRELVRALVPGGWLVLEEFDCTVAAARADRSDRRPPRSCSSRSWTACWTILQGRGADLAWAQNVHLRDGRWPG